MKKDYYTKSSTLKSFIFGIILLSSITMSLHAQSLTVQSPNGGEVWTYGQSEIITWTGNNLSNISYGRTSPMTAGRTGGLMGRFLQDPMAAAQRLAFQMFKPRMQY